MRLSFAKLLLTAALGVSAPALAQDKPVPLATPAKTPPPAWFAEKPLDTISVASFGRRTGISPDIWKQTNSAVFDSSLDLLTQGALTPSFIQFMTKLLTSAAMPPEDALHELSFLGQRALYLFAFGKPEETAFLIQQVSDVTNDNIGRQAQVKLMFLERKSREACDIVNNFNVAPDVFWLEAQVVCALLNNDTPRAELTLALLQEDGIEDTNITKLATRILRKDDGATPVTLKTLSILDVMLIDKGTIAPVFAFSRSENPALLGIISTMRHLPFDGRVKAAEIAVNAGVMPVERLRDFYNQYGFSELDIQNAGADATTFDGAQYRALLWQALFSQSAPAEQVTLMNKAMRLYAQQGLLSAAAQLFHPVVQRLSVDTTTMASLETLITVALLANDRPLAEALLAQVARQEDATAALARVWPLFFLATNAGLSGWENSIIAAWQQAPATPNTDALTTILFATLQARGYPLPEAIKLPTTSALEKDLVDEITLALEKGNQGTAVLLAMLVWQKSMQQTVHPAEIQAIVKTFDAIGQAEAGGQLLLDIFLRYVFAG